MSDSEEDPRDRQPAGRGAPGGRTELRRHAQYRDRWSSFGARTGIRALSERLSPEELARFEIFADYDRAFLERISPDVSIALWQQGAVLFEEGTYIDLAFYIVQGSVEVFLRREAEAEDASRPIFDAGRTGLWRRPGAASDARPARAARAAASSLSKTVIAPTPKGEITFLAAMDFDLPAGVSVALGPGELCGEIGAMSGWPQSVTARTASECVVVQIRVAALRLMRKRSRALKERLDAIYRQRSLADLLKATPLFQGLPPVFLDVLKEEVELVSCEPDEVIAREGEPAQALYLVRSGFVKLAQRFGEGEIVVNYLSKGMTLGEVELLVGGAPEWGNGQWTATARSVEFAELVEVPRARLEELARRFPQVEERLSQSAVARIREAGFARRNIHHSEFIQTALEEGLVQGNSILVIDLAACTRCDDCVRACAATHDGRPRFVREGDKYGRLQIASACYHCRDPVCLVGCPTGAIHRTGVGHVVAIDEKVCIGCQSCANNCPYDAIVMHETGETWPEDMVPEGLRGKPRLLASKCDLCHTAPAGPACVRNCPNGCAYRIGSLEEFEALLSKR